MKLRWKILIAAGIVFALLAVSLTVTMHVQPANELDACKKFLRDKGEKLELSELSPQPVAPEDNSRDSVEAAFRMLGLRYENMPDAMQMVAPGKALIGWQQPDVRGYDFTNSWVDFATNVDADRPAVDLLRQVLILPKLDFQWNYKQGVKFLMPVLYPLKLSARSLTAAAIFNLHNGDTGEAATNILILLEMIHKDAGQHLLIGHLVRLAMAAISVIPTWELLQATNATDEQLAALQNGWQNLDSLSDAESSFVKERIWACEEIKNSRSQDGFKETFAPMASLSSPSSSGGSSDWPEMLDGMTKGSRWAIGEVMWRSSWSYSDELKTLKSEQIILETLRAMQTNRSEFYKADYDAMDLRFSALGFTNTEGAIFRALDIPDLRDYYDDPGLDRTVRKTLQFETARRVVITAIALKRFQLKNGKWPGKLTDLEPEFLPSVLIDPFDGKPLKYRPNPDGTFLLYSVGENGVDDGGDPTGSLSWQDRKARDWVWPQPAPPAEVEHYYEHPPK